MVSKYLSLKNLHENMSNEYLSNVGSNLPKKEEMESE
jgi:hypothetical protein